MVPSELRAAMKATGEVIDRVRPDVIVGFGGYVSVPAYLVARRRGIPLVVHEGNAIPASRTSSAPGSPSTSPPASPTPTCRTPLHRAADPPRDLRAGPRRQAGRGSRALRARPRPSHAARHGRLPGRAAHQPRRGGCRPRPGRRRGPGAARGGPPTRSSSSRAGRPAVRRHGVHRPHGPGLRRRRPDRVPLRREHRHRGGGGRSASGVRATAARQWRTGPQRPPRRAGRGSAADRRRRPDLDLDRQRRHPAGVPHGRLEAMSQAASGIVRRDADERLADVVREAAEPREDPHPRPDPAGRSARSGALRRHRWSRALGHRPADGRSGHRGHGSDAADSAVLQALQAEGITCHVGQDAAHLDGVDTVIATDRRSRGQRRDRRGAAPAACGCGRGRPDCSRCCWAGGRSRSPAPTARPRRRRC